MGLKIATLNIEGHHHLDRFLPFLRATKPDVVCLQEVFASDLERIATVLAMEPLYAPMMTVETENKYKIDPLGEWGVALFTALTQTEPEREYYRKIGVRLPVFSGNPNDPWRVFLSTTLEKEGELFRVATTHFTWSQAGKPTDEQRQDFISLKQCYERHEKLVLCGDFNAPRGSELWASFMSDFADGVPQDITTTLDPLLHYAAPLELVVDGFFSKGYTVSDVTVVPGVSDHCAIVGQVSL